MKKHTINESVNRIDIFDERWYELTIEGENKPIYLPSVTTYLEAYPKGYGYELWLQNTKDPAAVRDEAAQLGSTVHDLIYRTLLGETIKYSSELGVNEWERYLAWCGFWKEFTTKNKVKINKNMVEKIVYSRKLAAAGTLDLLCQVGDEIMVLDWKTGKSVGATAHIQVSVYAMMAMEMWKVKINKCLIVQVNPSLNKKGYRLHEVTALSENYEDFLHIKKIWLRANSNPKPKFKSYPMEVNLEYIQNNDIVAVRPENK